MSAYDICLWTVKSRQSHEIIAKIDRPGGEIPFGTELTIGRGRGTFSLFFREPISSDLLHELYLDLDGKRIPWDLTYGRKLKLKDAASKEDRLRAFEAIEQYAPFIRTAGEALYDQIQDLIGMEKKECLERISQKVLIYYQKGNYQMIPYFEDVLAYSSCPPPPGFQRPRVQLSRLFLENMDFENFFKYFPDDFPRAKLYEFTYDFLCQDPEKLGMDPTEKSKITLRLLSLCSSEKATLIKGRIFQDLCQSPFNSSVELLDLAGCLKGDDLLLAASVIHMHSQRIRALEEQVKALLLIPASTATVMAPLSPETKISRRWELNT